MGRHTKHGGYVIEWRKVRTYVVPAGLKDFKVRKNKDLSLKINGLLTPETQLSPFVTRNMEPLKGKFGKDPKGALSGEKYLTRWEDENGSD